jgi:hypothetical protein
MAFDVVHISQFDGGLDLVSSLSTIEPGFTPSARNFRCNDRGGIDKATGYSAFATLGANAHELTYYEQRDGSPRCLVAAEPTAWQKMASDGTVTNIRTGMSTATETTFVQHEDYLYGLDRANNLGRWDGTTLTTYAPGVDSGPKLGIILGIWANRMWVAPSTGMRVEFSDPETFTGTGSWPADQYVELGGPGTSDKIVGGMPTADGLLVFTNRSTYLIYDETTGANRLLDAERGCASRKSLARVGDTVFGVCRDGVFAANGQGLQIISDRISPLYEKADPDLTNSAGLSWFGSYWHSMALDAATNDVSLELVTQSGSFMAIDYPAYAWATGELTSAEKLAFFVDASDRTKVRKAFDGGSFVGSDISCWYETPLDPLGDEVNFKRLRRVRIVGRGDLIVAVRVDYSSVDLDTDAMEFPAAGGGVWNTSNWNSAEWAGYQVFEGWAHLSAVGRRFSLRLSETSSDTAPARDALDQTISGSIGGAGAYLIEASFSRTSKRRQL